MLRQVVRSLGDVIKNASVFLTFHLVKRWCTLSHNDLSTLSDYRVVAREKERKGAAVAS